MYHFNPAAPLALQMYPDPGEDRSGPPLTQGFAFVLIRTIAADYCDAPTIAVLDQIRPESWYHGQAFETVLQQFEHQDSTLPVEMGKNIYYALRPQFEAMGMHTPTDVVTLMPQAWRYVTRGDSGEWRTRMLKPGHAIIEAEQPYNCLFEQGAVHGALEGFDALDVVINHQTCRRHGAPCCMFEVTWREAVASNE